MFFQSPCTTDVSLFLWETSSDEQNCFVLIRARLLPFSSPRLAIPLVNVVCLCFTYIFTKRLCINKTLCSHWLQELRSQLDTCLSDGTPLLVTDCSMQHILTDKRFQSVLASRSRFVSTNSPFKLMVCHLYTTSINEFIINILVACLKNILVVKQTNSHFRSILVSIVKKAFT